MSVAEVIVDDATGAGGVDPDDRFARIKNATDEAAGIVHDMLGERGVGTYSDSDHKISIEVFEAICSVVAVMMINQYEYDEQKHWEREKILLDEFLPAA